MRCFSAPSPHRHDGRKEQYHHNLPRRYGAVKIDAPVFVTAEKFDKKSRNAVIHEKRRANLAVKFSKPAHKKQHKEHYHGIYHEINLRRVKRDIAIFHGKRRRGRVAEYDIRPAGGRISKTAAV